ncbi:MAG: peptide ABC transporter substrate-binding protein [Thermomicrobiales bacterium]
MTFETNSTIARKRQTVRRWRSLEVLAAFALLFSGMASIAIAQDDPPYYSDALPAETTGGTVRYLLYEDPNNLNPLGGATTIALQVVNAITEGLTENDPDGNYVPVLAAELPTVENGGVSEDLLIITWKLKEGVLWSDGEPFTSDDVRFTWEAAVHPDSASPLASDYALITDVQTPDDLTAVVTYSEFNAGYLDQFPWILPRHAAGEPADMLNWDFNRNPVGTGPFKLDEWSSGEFIQLSRNENFREEGKPILDGLTFLIIPDETVRTQMMIEQGAEVMLWAGQEAETQIVEAGTGISGIAPGIWVMQMRFNLSMPYDGDPGVTPPHPMLGDVRVREAITKAIDRDRILNELLEGTTTFEIDSPLDVGWMACEVEPFVHDPEGAMALLDEAGWRDEDGDGVREAHGVEGVEDGTTLTMTMNGYTGWDVLELTELAVQEDLANVGIEVSIENQEFAVIFGTWEDSSPRLLGDYDILIYDSGWFAEPGKDITNAYHPDNVPSADLPGGDNFLRWVREDVGDWLEAGNTSPDIEVRRENYCNVANALREDVVVFPLMQFAEGSVYSTKLHGFTVSTWEYGTWDAENWWLEE